MSTVACMRRLGCLAVCGAIVLSAPGCMGNRGPVRIPVKGAVKLGQAPLAKGSLSMMPAEGSSGPAVTARVVDGQYEFTAENGPSAGPHKVTVLSEAVSKSAFMTGMANKSPQPGGEPTRRWDFQTVVPDKGPYQYDLTLD